jgi:putative oxidoreductase
MPTALARAARRLVAHRARLADLGLLFLRVGGAALLWNYHVLRKLESFEEELVHFPDPIGLGSDVALILALISEGLCSLLVALGLLTRVASLPIVLSMVMVLRLALVGFEGADVQGAYLYGLPYLALVALGPGRFSLDARLAPFYERRLGLEPGALR